MQAPSFAYELIIQPLPPPLTPSTVAHLLGRVQTEFECLRQAHAGHPLLDAAQVHRLQLRKIAQKMSDSDYADNKKLLLPIDSKDPFFASKSKAPAADGIEDASSCAFCTRLFRKADSSHGPVVHSGSSSTCPWVAALSPLGVSVTMGGPGAKEVRFTLPAPRSTPSKRGPGFSGYDRPYDDRPRGDRSGWQGGSSQGGRGRDDGRGERR